MKVARIYLRVSTNEQSLERQAAIVDDAKFKGYYIAGVYSEKASGARADRPELQRLIADLQPDDVIIAEKIDRISRLPLSEAEALIARIKSKGAKLAIPDVVDLSELSAGSDGIAKVVLDGIQEMLLRLALQMARDDYNTRRQRQAEGIAIAQAKGKYRGRRANTHKQAQVIALRKAGRSISETAALTGYSVASVKRIWANAATQGRQIATKVKSG